MTKPSMYDCRIDHLTRCERVSLLWQREVAVDVKFHATVVMHIFEVVCCTECSLQPMLLPQAFDGQQIMREVRRFEPLQNSIVAIRADNVIDVASNNARTTR